MIAVECWVTDLVACDTCGKVMDKEIQCDEDEHSISEAGVECHACSQERAADALADLAGYSPPSEDNEPDWDIVRDAARSK